ncbi:hypothetical protein NPIL_594611 [Nephila pilipes]|uniref:Uncharacterized protein n=1 Tax=Nephila pilipes TaxID=299642 RepID=A0A8X6ID80_NEPPI|nr:hypothetical protein NPIL_594611 [Nephila pilipes]
MNESLSVCLQRDNSTISNQREQRTHKINYTVNKIIGRAPRIQRLLIYPSFTLPITVSRKRAVRWRDKRACGTASGSGLRSSDFRDSVLSLKPRFRYLRSRDKKILIKIPAQPCRSLYQTMKSAGAFVDVKR